MTSAWKSKSKRRLFSLNRVRSYNEETDEQNERMYMQYQMDFNNQE